MKDASYIYQTAEAEGRLQLLQHWRYTASDYQASIHSDVRRILSELNIKMVGPDNIPGCVLKTWQLACLHYYWPL